MHTYRTKPSTERATFFIGRFQKTLLKSLRSDEKKLNLQCMFGLVYTLRGSSTLAAKEYERHHKDIARGDIDGCPCLLVSRIKQPWLLSAEGFGTSCLPL